jgi:hypothetical protein
MKEENNVIFRKVDFTKNCSAESYFPHYFLHFFASFNLIDGEFKNLAQLYIVVNLKRVTTIKVRDHGKKLHSNLSS